MKKHEYEIVVAGGTYERIVGPFVTERAAIDYARETDDDVGEGITIADQIAGGLYKVIALKKGG
jgi:hypothetical protein